jgi:5-methylcytosine-specific restriction endonuclease McrA
LRKRQKRHRFLCPACGFSYRKKCKYFDAKRRCPSCRAVVVPILHQAKREWMRSICTRPQGHAPEKRWTPATWGVVYSDYIRSEAWQEKRIKIIGRDTGHCRSCSNDASHVHHITYRHFGNEPSADLVLLCGRCHEFEHELYTLRQRESHWRRENELLEAVVGRSQIRLPHCKGPRIEAQQDAPAQVESQKGAVGSSVATMKFAGNSQNTDFAVRLNGDGVAPAKG